MGFIHWQVHLFISTVVFFFSPVRTSRLASKIASNPQISLKGNTLPSKHQCWLFFFLRLQVWFYCFIIYSYSVLFYFHISYFFSFWWIVFILLSAASKALSARMEGGCGVCAPPSELQPRAAGLGSLVSSSSSQRFASRICPTQVNFTAILPSSLESLTHSQQTLCGPSRFWSRRLGGCLPAWPLVCWAGQLCSGFYCWFSTFAFSSWKSFFSFTYPAFFQWIANLKEGVTEHWLMWCMGSTFRYSERKNSCLEGAGALKQAVKTHREVSFPGEISNPSGHCDP